MNQDELAKGFANLASAAAKMPFASVGVAAATHPAIQALLRSAAEYDQRAYQESLREENQQYSLLGSALIERFHAAIRAANEREFDRRYALQRQRKARRVRRS